MDAALERFLTFGYASTTLDSIAGDAGVSVATIHKTFGGKPGLVRALAERALRGRGPVPAERRSDALQNADADPREVIRGWGKLTAEVSPRIAPILLVLSDAADADAAASALLEELDAERLRRMSHNARFLSRNRHLRAGLRHRDAADVLWFYTSPHVYDLLVRRRGWSIARYSRFVSESIAAALL
jgi:AcrR family transcriptional regulator